MKKPYITLEEALAAREEGRRSVKFLTEANGCINCLLYTSDAADEL